MSIKKFFFCFSESLSGSPVTFVWIRYYTGLPILLSPRFISTLRGYWALYLVTFFTVITICLTRLPGAVAAVRQWSLRYHMAVQRSRTLPMWSTRSYPWWIHSKISPATGHSRLKTRPARRVPPYQRVPPCQRVPPYRRAPPCRRQPGCRAFVPVWRSRRSLRWPSDPNRGTQRRRPWHRRVLAEVRWRLADRSLPVRVRWSWRPQHRLVWPPRRRAADTRKNEEPTRSLTVTTTTTTTTEMMYRPMAKE